MIKSQWGKRVLSLALALTVGVSTMASSLPFVHAAADETISFKTQVGGVYDGMPLFDGNPEHLDAYVDAYFDYTGLEGPAVYATGSRNIYTLTRGVNAGKKIPGALAAADNVQGVSTDFPSLIGMGQTWNKELLADIGKVMGSEKISLLNVKQGDANVHGNVEGTAGPSLTVAFTVVSDMRINPLSGRFDEGYSEDAYMAATLIDRMAAGLSGTDQALSNDGFWMRAAVGTKHYSVYNAQWFRNSSSNSASARSIYEYQTRSTLKALSSGSVAGVMTSYGRTNGIPNIISPYQRYANNMSKYGVYSSPDFNGDAAVSGQNVFGNGYDTQYVPERNLATVLMALAQSNAGRPMGTVPEDVPELVDYVEKGTYGITAADLIEAARPHVNQMVRVGIFNETDDNAIPKFYPFAEDAKDVRSEEAATYLLQKHQDTALKAAQETVVLLKNDGVLPLAKEKKAAVSGVYADARFKTTYSVGVTPDIENSGISPLLAIMKANGTENVTYDPAGEIITLKSILNGQTVTASPGSADGAQLMTTEDSENTAQMFQVYDWGQAGASLRSLENGNWVTSPTSNNEGVENTDQTQMNLTNNDWILEEMVGDTSTIPPRLRIEDNSDQTVSIVANGYKTGFSGDFTDSYYSGGRFIITDADGKLSTASAPLTNAMNAAERDDSVKFERTVIKPIGADTVARADMDDYAIVFVGAIPRHSAGEGNDRSSLYMSDSDYELVNNVSAAFAAEGKKTIVVVKTSFPVVLEEIENNPNVSAIVYQPYGGQYDSQALAQVLYGDYAPTGRLSSTWYADMSALPEINEYVIPEGNTTAELGYNIDPRFVVDMTNSDPIESNLTYMYTNAPVTYEFGFGLSYSNFTYSNMVAPSSANGDAALHITVDVKNEGAIETSEVVQLYVNNKDSAYGLYAPKKQLASFEKVVIGPGETKTVTLEVDPKDFAVWDVNGNDFVVEKGTYTFMVGASSEDIRVQKEVSIVGEEIATLYVDKPFNVFDHSYASNEVVYYEASKARTAEQLKAKKVVGEYYTVGSKMDGSWVSIPKVNLTGATSVMATVASNATGGVITLHLDSPSNAPIAVIDVPVTQSTTYMIESAEVEVKELGYQEIKANLSNTTLTGTHDLYVVFNAADLRIDGLAFEGGGSPGTETPGTGSPGTSTPGSGDPSNGNPEAENPSKEIPDEVTPSVTVKAATESDLAKVEKINAAGVAIIGEPVNINVGNIEGSFALATIKISAEAGKMITTLARVSEDGTLTPIPSLISLNATGDTVITALVSQSGTYVAVLSRREFTDVAANAWYAQEITLANNLLLINGVSSTKMQPQGPTTVAQTIMVALNVLGITPEKAANDIKWYDSVLRAATKNGLVSNNTLAMDQAMTREEMAAVLMNVLRYAGENVTLSDSEINELLKGFSDAPTISKESRTALAVTVKYKIFKGTTAGNLMPNSVLKRSELAAVALRTRDVINSQLSN